MSAGQLPPIQTPLALHSKLAEPVLEGNQGQLVSASNSCMLVNWLNVALSFEGIATDTMTHVNQCAC